MKEKLLKSIVLLMAGIIVFSSTTLMFSAVDSTEAPDVTESTESVKTTESTAATESTVKESSSKAEDSSSSSVKNDESSTPVTEKETPPREHGSALDEEDSDYGIVTFDDRSFANQKTTKAPTKAPAKKTTKAPAKKTTKRAPINALETTVEESSSDIYLDELLETTAYVWTFAEEETEPEDNAKKSIDFKKIVIIAVIVLAVIGAGVCLIILGKKR